jgi:hypothetical protein
MTDQTASLRIAVLILQIDESGLQNSKKPIFETPLHNQQKQYPGIELFRQDP